MEQYKTRIACASTEPEPRPVISMGEFFKKITIDLWDPFALIFFILNTLHLLENGDYQYCYCKERKSEQKDFCQICKIPDILYGFESFVYNTDLIFQLCANIIFVLKMNLSNVSIIRLDLHKLFQGRTLLRWSRLEHR